MSFTIYTKDKFKCIQWFRNMDELINSMLNNPTSFYHRN